MTRICEASDDQLDAALVLLTEGEVEWSDSVPMPTEYWIDTGILLEQYRVHVWFMEVCTYDGPNNLVPVRLRSYSGGNRMDNTWHAEVEGAGGAGLTAREAVCRAVVLLLEGRRNAKAKELGQWHALLPYPQ